MGHRKATGTRFVEKTFDSQVASFQGRVAKLEAVYSGYNLSITIKTDKSDGKWTWKRQGWCQGSRATSGFKWLHACNCCGVLNWSHSKPFESKKFQQARSMKKCTQKCRLSIERPGVPVTCCDAAWLYGRSPVFVLKSLALWTRHDQWNHDFSTDLFRTRFLTPDDSVAGSELGPWRHHGWWPWRPLAIPRVRVTSPTSCHGEWTWTLQALGPHMFTFQGAAVRRLELRSGVTTLTYFHISRVVSFLHSIPFRFHDVFSCCFFGLKWDIRHNETHAIDESTTTRSSSQLLNLIFCDVLVMSHDVNMSPWVVPFMSPFPLSCQSQIGVPAFPLCCSILAIVFLSPFPFASLAFACLFRILFTSYSTRRQRCQNQLPVPKMPTNVKRLTVHVRTLRELPIPPKWFFNSEMQIVVRVCECV